MYSWRVLTSVHTRSTISTIKTRPRSQLGVPLSCWTPDVALHNFRLVLSTLEYLLNRFVQCWISMHVAVYLGDTCFKWFGVTPKCFSKANVLFYTVVDGTDLRLSDKCLLSYCTADVVTLAEGTGDTEISSSLLGENQKHSAMSKSLFTKSYSCKSPVPGLRKHPLHKGWHQPNPARTKPQRMGTWVLYSQSHILPFFSISPR